MKEFFNSWKSIKKQKKAEKLEYALKILSDYKYRRCSEVHFKVGNWNFWPTTGLFSNDKSS